MVQMIPSHNSLSCSPTLNPTDIHSNMANPIKTITHTNMMSHILRAICVFIKHIGLISHDVHRVMVIPQLTTMPATKNINPNAKKTLLVVVSLEGAV